MPSKNGVTLLEVLDSSAIVVWDDSRSALRAANFILRVLASESGVTPPAPITMQVTDWFYTAFRNDPIRATCAEEFLEHGVFELRSWRYNPFLVLVEGSPRRWFMIAFDRDGLEFGPVDDADGFGARILAAFGAE